jgi:nicotinamide mononucleotide transporter
MNWSGLLSWFHLHYIELLAVITGLLYLVYAIREKPVLWLFGIISSALYVWVFYHSGIYAYTLLYIYYVIIGFYGWYNWLKPAKKTNGEKALPIRYATRRELLIYLLIIVVTAIPVFIALKKFSDSDMALVDAILAASGMVATWMLTQKLIDQWLFWIIIDVVTVAVMIYKGLNPSALLFVAYSLLALNGYFQWRKEYKAGLTQK